MLHHLVGGSWGLVIRRPLESGAMNVLPLALLFVPIAFGVSIALSVGAGRVGRARGGRRTQPVSDRVVFLDPRRPFTS